MSPTLVRLKWRFPSLRPFIEYSTRGLCCFVILPTEILCESIYIVHSLADHFSSVSFILKPCKLPGSFVQWLSLTQAADGGLKAAWISVWHCVFSSLAGIKTWNPANHLPIHLTLLTCELLAFWGRNIIIAWEPMVTKMSSLLGSLWELIHLKPK